MLEFVGAFSAGTELLAGVASFAGTELLTLGEVLVELVEPVEPLRTSTLMALLRESGFAGASPKGDCCAAAKGDGNASAKGAENSESASTASAHAATHASRAHVFLMRYVTLFTIRLPYTCPLPALFLFIINLKFTQHLPDLLRPNTYVILCPRRAPIIGNSVVTIFTISANSVTNSKRPAHISKM